MELLGVVPSGAADIKLARGCRARVEALRQRNDLNGAIVDVQREAGGGRWICQTPGGETISVNETNLVVTAGWSLAALIMPAAGNSASDAEIEEDTLRWIAAPLGLSDITALALADDHESLTPRHVSLIVAACTRLQSLDLSTCQSAVTDDGLGSLGRLPALTELDVSQTAVSDEGLRLLAEGPPVESREVRNGERSRGLYASLGAALGGSIAGLRQLESLSLRRCIHITDEGLLHIAQRCPSLRALDLSGCGPKVSDRSLLAVAHNRCLSTAILDSCRSLSDTAIAALARLCPLTQLSLRGDMPQVTPFGMRALSEGSGRTLSSLAMGEWATDAAVVALAERCVALSRLRLHGCAKLTPDGLLSAAGPGFPALAELEVDWGCALITQEAVQRAHASLAADDVRQLQLLWNKG